MVESVDQELEKETEKETEKEILRIFDYLERNSVPMPADIQQIVDEHFWELLGDDKD